MSFSRNIKKEIMENKPMLRHHKESLRYGLFSYCQYFSEKEISLRTQQKEVAEFFVILAKEIIGDSAKIKLSDSSGNFRAWIVNKKQRLILLEHYNGYSLDDENPEEVQAFLAGAYLACGNMTDPNKSYHLEFVTPTKEKGEWLLSVIHNYLSGFKIIKRRTRWVVYSKECGQIQDILTMIGASKYSLDMINIEMFKSVRNHANRVTNCETANIDKTVKASTNQIQDIKLVLSTVDEEKLGGNLLATANLRLENPFSSLRELSELSPSKVSRSGIHHRLATLSKMAEEIRNAREENSSD